MVMESMGVNQIVKNRGRIGNIWKMEVRSKGKWGNKDEPTVLSFRKMTR